MMQMIQSLTILRVLQRMRVVKLRQRRVVTASLAAALGLGLLYLVLTHGGEREEGGGAHSPQRAPAPPARHQSHPGQVPQFLGSDHKGNFEPGKPAGGAGPGHGGAAHKLRVEQKQEEEKMKGVYGFNQLASDEISLNRTVPDQREEVLLLPSYNFSPPSINDK